MRRTTDASRRTANVTERPAPTVCARPFGRIVSGSLLAVGAVASVAATVAIVVLRIGFMPVLSNSMSPTFDAGSVIITVPRAAHEVQMGDVAVLPLPDDPGIRYAHRIVERRSRSGRIEVVTKGDANTAPDDWRLSITSDSVPVVVASIPHLGWARNLVGSGAPRLALAAMVVVASILGIRRALGAQRPERRSPDG